MTAPHMTPCLWKDGGKAANPHTRIFLTASPPTILNHSNHSSNMLREDKMRNQIKSLSHKISHNHSPCWPEGSGCCGKSGMRMGVQQNESEESLLLDAASCSFPEASGQCRPTQRLVNLVLAMSRCLWLSESKLKCILPFQLWSPPPSDLFNLYQAQHHLSKPYTSYPPPRPTLLQ